MDTLEEIWAGDLFDRQSEAGDLIGYLESVAGRPAIREDGHAHVLAVDTRYGQGKTFFLKRLDRHLRATDHVSAYVDAWVDDLEDEPIVALAATLDTALKPWCIKDAAVAAGMSDFKAKAGRVAKIVGIGLAKRGVGFLITQGAAEALSDEIASASDTSKDIATDALKGGGSGLIDDVTSVFGETALPSMNTRIARFREGQAAIQAMKESLLDVVGALEEAGMRLPIVVIVDELDRCRPTYAIKTLEEIKHLFDVPGVAFILGMHGQQLSHSVGAAYGQGFDGAAYLRRFFNRRYSLRPVSLTPLVSHLISALSLPVNLLEHPPVQRQGGYQPEMLEPAELIAAYIQMYELDARDAFSIVESLQTALALTRRQVQLSYLLPLIIGQHRGLSVLSAPGQPPGWQIAYGTDPFGREFDLVSVGENVRQIGEAAALTDQELSAAVNANDRFARLVANYGFANGKRDYNLLQNYRTLIGAVARFT